MKEIKNYINFSKVVKEDKGIDYYTSEFRKRLEQAVDDELISDTPICTILSGGIDSTIITYLLKKKNPNIEAFVVNVTSNRKQTLKDDLYYAKIASKELGVRLHEVNVSKEDIQNKFGVNSSKIIDVQALAGDSSDNVPGVPGIGVKTAAELILSLIHI